ncbi:MAG: hypothetical protein HYS43_00515 [Candidatus Liptonbacteria bacterium]|nr:hypothetical protein [Candidatus Liptonbacteria bacterium]
MVTYFSAIALLSGTIIGAGMFALPYAVSRTGWAVGAAYLVVFALAAACIHLFYADIMLRISGRHRLPGYAGRVFGPAAKRIVSFVVLLGMLFTLAAYVSLAPSFFSLLGIGGVSSVVFFWASASVAAIAGVAVLAGMEAVALIGILAVIILLLILSDAGSAARSVDMPALIPQGLFLPFGPVLFALAGGTAVPPLVDYVASRAAAPARARILRISILAGTLIPAVVYFAFVFGVFGVADVITPDAVSGFSGRAAFTTGVVGVLGLAAIWSSYIAVGRTLFDTLRLDSRAPAVVAGLILFLFPPALYLFSGKDFFLLVSVAGGVLIALEQIVVLLLWYRTRATGIFTVSLFKRAAIRGPVFAALLAVFLAGLFYFALSAVRFLSAAAIQ